MKLICTFVRGGWGKDSDPEWGDMFAFYRALSSEDMPAGSEGVEFSAKGVLLPCCKFGTIELEGEWETKTRKYGPVFHVTGFHQSIPDSTSACADYLSYIPGCGMKTAIKIANALGDCPMSKLDIEGPDVIRKIINSKRLAEQVIQNLRVLQNRETVFYLSGLKSYTDAYGKCRTLSPMDFVSCAKVAAMSDSLREVQCDPFRFTLDSALPYSYSEGIAALHKVPMSSMAVKAALVESLKQSEGCSQTPMNLDVTGNTYCDVGDLLSLGGSLCGYPADDPELISALQELLEDEYCVCAEGRYIYRKATADAEYQIANEVLRLLSNPPPPQREYRDDIYCMENKRKMRLAPEQRRAIKTCLAHNFSLLIGGPGTGKTTIEEFIISVFQKYNQSSILLLAPTGKAARRMSDSCGLPACTAHKALNVNPDSDLLSSDVKFDAGLILVDEASMLDTQICAALLKAIQDGTQVVMIGDTNQLPSVGAGNVLFELISSGVVPIARLVEVYRQAEGSCIARNCARIKEGILGLDYAENFIMKELPGSPLAQMSQAEKQAMQKQAQQVILDIYKSELDKGRASEDICILSPFRRSTLCGVNSLNQIIQKTCTAPGTPMVTNGRKVFYLGDRLMYMRNSEEVSNGDTGYVVEVNGGKFVVDFHDGRVITFGRADIRDFELAYAITIHKSQGAEFPVCIIPVLPGHESMLKRNLLYTAISRAKTLVYLVGTTEVLNCAVACEEVTKRRSRLGLLLSRAQAA